MLSNKRTQVVLILVAVLALIAGVAVTYAAGERTRGRVETLTFDVAEDGRFFVWDDEPVFDDGLPQYGNSFVTRGYIFPAGTLDGSNGFVEDENGELQLEFPDLVIGEWVCRGWFIGDGAHTETGPWVITTQVYNFSDEYGNVTLVTDGYEVSDLNKEILRAITGGTGQYHNARGEGTQALLGFNATEGVNLTFDLAVVKR